jgi:hypothetical protein
MGSVFLVLMIPAVIIGIPLGIWMICADKWDEGAGARASRRENRKFNKEAKQAYLMSLSPEERREYEWHEERKRQYYELDPMEKWRFRDVPVKIDRAW